MHTWAIWMAVAAILITGANIGLDLYWSAKDRERARRRW
jgi:hypothetical protein